MPQTTEPTELSKADLKKILWRAHDNYLRNGDRTIGELLASVGEHAEAIEANPALGILSLEDPAAYLNLRRRLDENWISNYCTLSEYVQGKIFRALLRLIRNAYTPKFAMAMHDETRTMFQWGIDWRLRREAATKFYHYDRSSAPLRNYMAKIEHPCHAPQHANSFMDLGGDTIAFWPPTDLLWAYEESAGSHVFGVSKTQVADLIRPYGFEIHMARITAKERSSALQFHP